MMCNSDRKGYVLLLTVLVVGVVASASSAAIILLGLGVERTAFSIQQSTQAYNGAWTCMENAILSLQDDLSYAGNEERAFVYGYDDKGSISYDTTNCTIYPIGGEDNEDRIICTEGTFGNFTTRKLEVTLSRILPSTIVDSWEEVKEITLCDPFTGPPPANCGNGDDTDPGEECDDSNDNNRDSCTTSCLDAECGDGYTWDTDGGTEECDDGDTVNENDCSNSCEIQICGDGIQRGIEECDDNNYSNIDSCAECLNAECGDTHLWYTDGGTEECDDGNTANNDGCDENCLLEVSADPSPLDYIAYWKLDELNISADVVDSSNGHTGTPENGVDVDAVDKAVLNFETNAASRDFDGSDDYIDLNDNAVLFPSDMTVSFWTKNDVPPQQWDGIICKTDSTNWTKGWGFFYDSSSQIHFFVQRYNLNYARVSINPLEWNHITGTYDGNTLRIYVNGVEGTSDSYSGSINKGRKLTIGRCGDRDGANSYNIDGKIDDVRIYDRVLTPAEIQALASGN